MKRAIQKWIDDYVTEYIIDNNPKQGTEITVDYDSDKDESVVIVPKKSSTRKKKKSEE